MCACPGELPADGVLGAALGGGRFSWLVAEPGQPGVRGAPESRPPLGAHRGQGRMALLGFTQWRGVGKNFLDNF